MQKVGLKKYSFFVSLSLSRFFYKFKRFNMRCLAFYRHLDCFNLEKNSLWCCRKVQPIYFFSFFCTSFWVVWLKIAFYAASNVQNLHIICISTIGSQPKSNINGEHFTILIDLNEMEKRPNWFNRKSITNWATNSIIAKKKHTFAILRWKKTKKKKKQRKNQIPFVRVLMHSVFSSSLTWLYAISYVLIMVDKHASLLKHWTH